jgi:hypothetical protein
VCNEFTRKEESKGKIGKLLPEKEREKKEDEEKRNS